MENSASRIGCLWNRCNIFETRTFKLAVLSLSSSHRFGYSWANPTRVFAGSRRVSRD